jgi:hypothetical protein
VAEAAAFICAHLRIVRIMLTSALMPSATVDLSDGDAVRHFVHDHIVKGLGP